MRDAIALYAPDPAPRNNRIPCPVHGGTHYNMSFTDRLYHCHVCQSSGDVIHFVQHIFGMDFLSALERLNSDFNLALPINRRPTLRELRDAQRRHRELMAAREKQEAKRRSYNALYDSLWGEWIRLDRNRTDYAPQSPDAEWTEPFVEALRKMDHQSYLIDTLL